MNRIKLLREENSFTQQDLATRLECSKSVIGLYESETRKPSMEVLIKLSEIFNCSIDYIIGKSDIRNPKEINVDDADIRNSDELNQIQFANAGGLDTKGLDTEDLKELQKQIDYIKKLKGKK